VTLGAAGPASAHATIVSTDPPDGALVATAPAQISVQFDEAVGVSADSLRVFSPNDQLTVAGSTTHGAQADIITIHLRPGLATGTYTVAWHVISADSHPVSGAFTFSIGAPSHTAVTASAIATKSSTFVGVSYGIARWAAYLSFALFAGAVMFLTLCWPKGAGLRGPFRLIVGGWTVLVASSVAQLLLQGVYSTGLPFTRVFDLSLIRATSATRLGTAIEVRLVMLAVCAPVVMIGVRWLAAARFRHRMRAAALALVGVMSIAATWAATGHASIGTQIPVSVVSDTLHVTAMSIWIGGLVILALVALRNPQKPKQAAAAVTRFSTVALTCVCVIIVTGTYQTWRDAGSMHALLDTAYGRLILVKIGGLLLLMCLGYYARVKIATGLDLTASVSDAGAELATLASAGAASKKAVPLAAASRTRAATMSAVDVIDSKKTGTAASAAATSRRSAAGTPVRKPSGRTAGGPGLNKPGRRTARVGSQPQQPDAASLRTLSALSKLRRSVALETAIAIIVLAATAIVVNSAPGSSANAPSAQGPDTGVSLPFNTGKISGTIQALVTPGKVGLNESHLLIENATGGAYSPAQVKISYSLPSRKIGPLFSTVANDGPGHYIDTPTQLSIPGAWDVAITIRSDDFDETTVHLKLTVN
jgi:copper transport protein